MYNSIGNAYVGNRAMPTTSNLSFPGGGRIANVSQNQPTVQAQNQCPAPKQVQAPTSQNLPPQQYKNLDLGLGWGLNTPDTVNLLTNSSGIYSARLNKKAYSTDVGQYDRLKRLTPGAPVMENIQLTDFNVILGSSSLSLYKKQEIVRLFQQYHILTTSNVQSFIEELMAMSVLTADEIV